MIEDIVEVDKLPQRITYLNKVLAYSMGLKNELIASSSIKESCLILWKEEKEKDEKIKFIKNPEYSKDLKNKLFDIGIRPARKNYRSKKLATFVIVALISATAFFSQNSEARDAFFGWIIETFSTHSTFTPQGINNPSSNISLDDIEISYILEGYEFYQKINLDEEVTYEYINSKNELLLIYFSNVYDKNSSISINTEGSEL